MARKVGIIVGSLRKESYTRRIADKIVEVAGAKLAFEPIAIDQLSFFNQDLEAQPPESWVAFRDRITASDAILFATPEYNRSVPGVLKNAVDVGSRPYGKGALAGKPAAIVSVTPGSVGAFGANHHLRQSLMFLDMPVLSQPELYISNASKLLEGALPDSTRDLFAGFVDKFAAWIEAHAKK